MRTHPYALSSGEGKEKGEATTKVLSIRAIMWGLCLVTAAGMAGTSVASLKTCDNALETANDAGDKAFERCIENSMTVTAAMAMDGLSSTTQLITGRITDQFKVFEAENNRLHVHAIHDYPNTDISTFSWLQSAKSSLLIPLLVKEYGLVSVLMNSAGKHLYGYSLQEHTQQMEVFTNDGTNTTGNNLTHSTTRDVNRSTLQPEGAARTIVLGPGWHNPETMLYLDGISPLDEITWNSLVTIGGRLVLYQLFHFMDPTSKNLMGIHLALSLRTLSGYLLQAIGGGKSGRYFIVVAESWITDAYMEMVPPHPDLAEFHNDTGILIAVSHGQPYRLEGSVELPCRDVDADDNQTAATVRAVHDYGGYVAVRDTGASGVAPVAIEGVPYYVMVKDSKPAIGISWYIVGSVQQRELLAEAEVASAETYAARVKAKDHASSQVDDSRTTILLISSFITAMLFGISVVVSALITRPVKALQEKMKDVAEMDLTGGSVQQLSMLYEIYEIQKSFTKMVQNLQEYRAYVPAAILRSGSSISQVQPPEGDVAFVFTDIVGSTALWSKAPIGMDKALEIHNRVMRAWCQKEEGYEVKTIGDAFMVAFTSPEAAMNFCLGVQGDLLLEVWPEELELPPIAGKMDTSVTVWNGIRVRMGLHYGPAILEENPLTGRSDYRGTTVNKASRVEAKANAGTVCITEEVAQRLGRTNNVMSSHGRHELKGLGEHQLTLVTQASLQERLTATEPDVEVSITSPTSSSLKGLSVGPRVKRTQLSLVNDMATVAACSMLDTNCTKVFESCNLMIRAVCEVASQTEGIVGGITGGTITVTWNTSKACRLHTTAAMRFTAELERRAGGVLRVGVATGELTHGNVGTQMNRYQNIFGTPLLAAEAAAAHTVTFNTFAVFADCTDDGCAASSPNVGAFVRIVDSWQDTATEKVLRLYELNTEKFLTYLEDGWDVEQKGNTTAAYSEAYYKALAGKEDGLATLQAMTESSPDDDTLRVCFVSSSSSTTTGGAPNAIGG